ncbi:MAG: electron transfer flavoprotein subunit alpha/FixB family protein, partial [Desulfobacterales bacterium]|nr:electron transfer flavoprotein subunit alpha/FixB family protein [Desulfobacterales bacterium]
LVMDCVDVHFKTLQAKTSQYSGKALATVQVTGSPSVFGIRPNAVPARLVDAAVESPNGVTLAPDITDPVGFKILDAAAEVGDPDALPSLAEAEIIIAGGRGMKSKENFQLLFDCARKLKAAVGASRVAVDNDWISYAHQVGQTGEKVSPTVYIACGISGSIQHFAGMKTARIIIALNTDADAAIMSQCDYAVQGDLFEILPELKQRL